jgi:DNA-damage-inducible protein D
VKSTILCLLDMLSKRGIKPEELPAAEDIKKIEQRVAGNEKKIEKDTNKLPKINE